MYVHDRSGDSYMKKDRYLCPCPVHGMHSQILELVKNLNKKWLKYLYPCPVPGMHLQNFELKKLKFQIKFKKTFYYVWSVYAYMELGIG